MTQAPALPTTRRIGDVHVGDELPPLVIELSPTLIVSTAIATRDYQDVHHNRDLAQAKGSKDIFMNILTSNGLVGRFVTDWAGPEARLERIAIRLGAQNLAYDTLTLTGKVTQTDDRSVEVAVTGSNSLGDHVVGTVVVALPTGDAS